MSRPKPVHLMEKVDKNYVSLEILVAPAVWAVFWDDKHPINIRRLNTLLNGGGKYKRAVFSNPGHAFTLKRKLNKLFSTDKFSVYEMTLQGGRKLDADYVQDLPESQPDA